MGAGGVHPDIDDYHLFKNAYGGSLAYLPGQCSHDHGTGSSVIMAGPRKAVSLHHRLMKSSIFQIKMGPIRNQFHDPIRCLTGIQVHEVLTINEPPSSDCVLKVPARVIRRVGIAEGCTHGESAHNRATRFPKYPFFNEGDLLRLFGRPNGSHSSGPAPTDDKHIAIKYFRVHHSFPDYEISNDKEFSLHPGETSCPGRSDLHDILNLEAGETRFVIWGLNTKNHTLFQL